MTDHDDEALARLRRADPAAGAHPDLHRLSDRLRRRTPLGSSTGDDSDGDGWSAPEHGFTFAGDSAGPVRVQDPAAGTGRVGMFVAAAVVAAAVGVGGYALGLNSGRGDPEAAGDAAGGTDEELLEAYQDLAAEDQGDDLGYSSSHSGSAMSGGDMGWAGPAVPVTSEGLSEEGTTGEVLAMDAVGEDPVDRVTEAAAALGMQGEVEGDEHFAALYDPVDGRSLNYYAYGSSGSLDYNNPALDSYCTESDMGWFGQDGPTDLVCAEEAPPPSSAEAVTITSEFAEQVGLDTAGLEFEVLDESSYYGEIDPYAGELEEGTDDAETTSSPDLLGAGEEFLESWLVDPYATGPQHVTVLVNDPASPAPGYLEWHVQVAAEGVVYASIPVSTYRSLGQYDVISPADAVDRVGDPRYNQVGVYIPALDEAYWSEEWEEWEEPGFLGRIEAGQPIPYPVTEATVTGAELHQGVLSLWDGTEYVVPTYNLTDDAGNSWQVLALAEDQMDFTP